MLIKAIKQSMTILLTCWVMAFWCSPARGQTDSTRHAVPVEHPRLLGTREHLQKLAIERPSAYTRMKNVITNPDAGDHEKMISLSLVCAIERDSALGRQAVDLAMNYINGPIRVGHETFGHDLARCAIVYDLCWEYWTAEERTKFHTYMNATVDANVTSETSPFHNAWYGYKHWGIGLACYATYYENSRAPSILAVTEDDYLKRAAPCLELAGDGGGWAEGYYVNYWSYEWMFFCEVARICSGINYYALAPKFFNNRAVASMFEAYPGIRDYGSRRPIPMGDGGGRVFGGDRDKALSARRILASYFRTDPAMQAVHAFNETTPRSSVGVYAYKDFLWRDTTVVKGDLKSFKLSHYSPGPGYVYARSSWDEDATYFFFKCGDRFTAHQHLDNGHFLIAKYEELAGDGGHYENFGSIHDVNYHLRTIAHSTILVMDPTETWPDIRANTVTANDGGQHHNWPHHNGAVEDAAAWQAGKNLYDIADMLAYDDQGSYLYVAGDCSRSYSSNKLDFFTRQIIFIRPNTFVIFDRVKARISTYQKTWVLQAMKAPTGTAPNLVIANGDGKLFLQILLPRMPWVKLFSGENLYTIGGRNYPPEWETGPAPECRVEVSPVFPAATDYFLNVLTTTDASTSSVSQAILEDTGKEFRITVGKAKVSFAKDSVSYKIDIAQCSMPGDVNSDGVVNIFDLVKIVRFALGLENPTDQQSLCADVNEDGKISVSDVVASVKKW